MKKYSIFAAALYLAASPAAAEDLESKCVAFTTENGGDASGCACLAAAAGGSVLEELMNVQSNEDMEMLSKPSKDAIAMCWPDA